MIVLVILVVVLVVGILRDGLQGGIHFIYPFCSDRVSFRSCLSDRGDTGSSVGDREDTHDCENTSECESFIGTEIGAECGK